ncbi:16S rRNA (guanine(527)-N(7))-methyltransferase RsmG [Desulfarculus baarsii]
MSNFSPLSLDDVRAAGQRLAGGPLPADFWPQCQTLLEELLRWNQSIRLVGHRAMGEAWLNLALDGLAMVPLLGPGRLLDIGAGAGFPGLVLALALPALTVTMIDGRAKKVSFQKHAARLLGLGSRVAPVVGRAGEGALAGQSFDFVSLRAVTDVAGSLALARPFCRPGGLILLPRAQADEAACLANGMAIHPYELPQLGRRLVATLRAPA